MSSLVCSGGDASFFKSESLTLSKGIAMKFRTKKNKKKLFGSPHGKRKIQHDIKVPALAESANSSAFVNSGTEAAQISKKAGKKRRSKRKALTIALMGIAAIVFSFSCYKLIGIYSAYSKGSEEYAVINNIAIIKPETQQEIESPYLRIDSAALREINEDYVGWIDIPDTNISYPMVKSFDNAYYLRRSFEGQSYIGGVIFLDYLCSSDFSSRNTVIYGHHMNDGTMFADLAKFVKQSYFEDHREIRIYCDDSVRVYKIITAYQTTIADACYQIAFADDEDSGRWIDTILGQSYFDADIALSSSDKIITLSTCTNGNKTDRYVIQAVLSDVIPQ